MGPRACLDGCEKSRPPPGFDPRTVQLVASQKIYIYIYIYIGAWVGVVVKALRY